MTRYLINRKSNDDLVLRVNKGGVPTDVLKINGTTGLAAISQDPTALSDADATRMGLKEYRNGVPYFGGISMSVGGQFLNSTSLVSVIPRQDQSGSWWIKVQVIIQMASGTNGDFYITGCPGHATQNYPAIGGCISTASAARGYSGLGGVDLPIAVRFAVAVADYTVIGDFKLASKPTWAY